MRLLLPILMLVGLWSWETLRPLFHWPQHRGRHAFRNLSIAVFNAVVTGALFGTATVLAANWTVENRFGVLQLSDQYATVRFVVGLILLDGWMYFWHRLNHHMPLLWRFHRMHHSDLKMDVTTATRFHIGEHMISAGLRLMLIPLFGLSVWQIVVYEMAVVAMTHFHHANISIGRTDRVFRWLIVTPDMHKVHHSRWQPETDSNYSVVLSIWDRVARTFRYCSNVNAIEFGLDKFADERWQTIGGMMKTPLAEDSGASEPDVAESESKGGDQAA